MHRSGTFGVASMVGGSVGGPAAGRILEKTGVVELGVLVHVVHMRILVEQLEAWSVRSELVVLLNRTGFY